MNSKLTVGSMFAGVGGICQAFENAGFLLKWANEFDSKACITYRENFSHKLLECDVSTIPEPLIDAGSVDVITSGFPCQAFSIAGYRKGFEDPRGNLFFETARFIKTIQPKAFLLENVKNLKSHDHGKTIEVIKNTITNDLNYSFISFVLNACEYGDIPQNRERIYIVGFKNEGGFKSPDQKNLKQGTIDTIENDKYFYSSNFRIPEKVKLTKKIADLLETGSIDTKYYYKNDHIYYERLNKEMNNVNTLYQWRRVYVRENKSNLCPTLTANMGTGGHNVPLLRDKNGIRKLTPKECFRFQGFPESFKLPEMNNSSLYKQAGNSVVVTVVQRIAEEINRVLNLKNDNI